MPAAAAVRLTWKALGPDPYDRDRGDSSDSGRSTGMLWPAVATNTASEVPPTRARAPRREMVGRPGLAGDQTVAGGVVEPGDGRFRPTWRPARWPARPGSCGSATPATSART